MSQYGVSDLGKQLAFYRREAKISAEELAERAGQGLTRSIVANIENGRKGDLSVRQLLALAYALGVSPASLLFDGRRPYSDFVLVEDSENPVVVQSWLARGYFGGSRNTYELWPGRSVPSRDEAERIISFDLDNREATLYALEHHELKLAQLRGHKEPDPDLLKGMTLNQVQDKIRTFKVELFEMERRLRAFGVDVSGSVQHPAPPF